MRGKAKVLPDAILRRLSPEDRRALGVAGWTKDDCEKHAQAKNERELQRQIVQLLRLKGVEPLWHRTDKRSTANVGWPDITFAVRDNLEYHGEAIACAWEIKFADGRLSDEQEQLIARLQSPPNNWRVRVIRSVDEALAELKELGL